ncbi:MAG: hypothetical protein R2708_28890 [Vicinamibacterales bacterium]
MRVEALAAAAGIAAAGAPGRTGLAGGEDLPSGVPGGLHEFMPARDRARP